MVGKIAPELPVILGTAYRDLFLAYAHGHPMSGGYRRDALDFAEHLLASQALPQGPARRELRAWWLERSGPAPRSRKPVVRAVRAARRVLQHR